MALRNVIMPDGHIIRNVPEDVTDDEVVAKYSNKKLAEEEIPEAFEAPPEAPKAEEEEPEESFAKDYARTITRTGASIANLPMELIKAGREAVGLDTEVAELYQRRVTEAVAKDVSTGAAEVPVKEILTSEGKIKSPETVGGMVFSAAPYLVGGAASMSTKLVKALPRLVQGVASGVAVDQILYDGEDNLANVLDEAGLVEAEGFAKDLVDFFAVKKDDGTLERRAKLIAEGVVLGGAFEAILGGTFAAAKAAKAKFNKILPDLNAEEKSELIVDYLKEARETVEYRASPDPVDFSETPEGVAQVLQQSSSGVKRFMQQVFTSRGYFTPKAYNAFNDAQYAQRQVVAQAESVSNRLQKAIRAIGDEVDSSELVERINRALTGEELDVPLPENIAKEVEQARDLIDEMSARIIDSSIPNDEFREAIAENAGSYLRRSYRLFEDTGYKPSANIRQNAIDYIANTILGAKKDIRIEKAFQEAEGVVESILGEVDGEKKVFEYFQGLRRVNTEILQGRKDIPEPIRKLMGEITEPSENIVLTVSKMARLVETNKFFESVNKLGADTYIFDSKISIDGVSFTSEITGTNSVLDGKFTTPQILTALKEKESMLFGDGDWPIAELYRNFLTMKGGAQMAKTVYSHVTHLRNILGGAQFGMANGTNPFGKQGVQTLQVLKNQIQRGGTESYDELYQKYLRLGIINTNVRVNEFRALLDTGFESKAGTFAQKISEKLKGYGLSDEAQKLPEEIYMAVDDFYKITNFEYELQALKGAFPDEALEVLEARAADIVQNTFPNYDRVPKGIKAVRYLPVGNFVSFPTEIWRTSANILKQAAAEINSGNEVLKGRGMQRLAGFGATMTGWSAIAGGSAQLAGLTSDEAESAQYLSETPWSRSPRNFARIDGELYANDTQFINSYSAISTPFVAAYKAIQDGTLREQELDRVLGDAIVEGSNALLAPYVEESILTAAIVDIGVAYRSESGRTAEGKQLFAPGMPFTEKAVNGFAHIAQAFEPGSVKSLRDLAGAALEVPNKNTGQPKSLGAELFTNLTGVRFTKLNPEDALMYAIKDYNYRSTNIVRPQAKFGMEATDVTSRYEQRQKKLYEYQQDLYTKYIATEQLMGRNAAIKILVDNGMSREQIGFLIGNTFRPERPSMNLIIDMFQKLPPGEQANNREAVTAMFKQYADFYRTKLIPPVEEPTVGRQRRAKGGEVLVPQAPSEPDERIDKMTGLPYNIQAGSAFIDEEDPEKRMAFNKGGIAQMLGIEPEDLEWAKGLGKKFGEAEELDGRGDAARHLALGWLAKKSNYPSLTKFAINAREVLELDFKGGPMDVENNKRGFNLTAGDRQEAEQQIMDMIGSGDATFFTPQESRQRRGYVEGGGVEEEDGFFDRLSSAFVQKVFGDGSLRQELMEKETTDFQMTPAGPIAKDPEIDGPLQNYVGAEVEEYMADTERNQKLLEENKITTTERDIRNLGEKVDLVLAPVNDLVDATIDYIPYFEEVSKYISETDAAQALAKLAKDNPRATEDLVALSQVIGIIPAVKVLERGINRTAGNVATNIEEFYKTENPIEKLGIMAEEFIQAVPSSVKDALTPQRSNFRNRTGVSEEKMDKVQLELNRIDKETGNPVKNRLANAVSELLTSRYIGRQSGEDRGIIHERNPLSDSNDYGMIDSFDDETFRKQVFTDNIKITPPKEVQDDAIAHMLKVWGVAPNNTMFVFKRPDGPSNLGNEAVGIAFGGSPRPKPMRHIFSSEFLKYINRDRERDGLKPVKTLRSVTPEQVKNFLLSKQLDVEKGPGDFLYVKSSHKSASKEIGGVNNFTAINTETGDVFNLITDKHDIGPNLDPILGKSLITAMPMVSRNFKTGKKGDYKKRDRKKEALDALKLGRQYNVKISDEDVRKLTASNPGNSGVAVTLKILEELRNRKTSDVEDVLDVSRRVGTAAAVPVLTGSED